MDSPRQPLEVASPDMEGQAVLENSCCVGCERWMGFEGMDTRKLYTSYLLRPWTLVLWRAFVTTFCAITVFVSWSVNMERGKTLKRYIFLTNWSFDLLTIYFGLAALCGLQALHLRPGQTLTWGLRARVVAVLFQLCVSTAFTVTVLYWSLLASTDEQTDDRYRFSNPVVHAANSGFMFIEIFLSRMDFHRRHFFMVPLFAVSYIAWNAAYTLGVDSVIYNILDYKSGATVVWIFLSLALAFLCFPFGSSLTALRERLLAHRGVKGAHGSLQARALRRHVDADSDSG